MKTGPTLNPVLQGHILLLFHVKPHLTLKPYRPQSITPTHFFGSWVTRFPWTIRDFRIITSEPAHFWKWSLSCY